MSGSIKNPVSRFLEHEQAPLAEAEVVFVPLPFEQSVSYITGTAQGPEAVLAASSQLEDLEEELGWSPTDELKIHCLEQVTPKDGESQEAYLARIDSALAGVPPKAFTVGVGGEHTVTIPLVKKSFSGRAADGGPDAGRGTVIVIDAHPDLRDSYECSRYSHACVMRRLVEEGFNVLQVGLGTNSEHELAFAAGRSDVVQFFSHQLATQKGFARLLEHVGGLSGQCYLSIDCDGLCTSIMPGVGTPVPGGLGWHKLLMLFRAIWANPKLSVLSMDVVELRPLDGNPLSEFTAAKIIQKCLSYGFHQARGLK